MEQLSGAPAVPAKPERKIHTLDIAGIPVEFPFDPYPCQVRRVWEGLQRYASRASLRLALRCMSSSSCQENRGARRHA